MEEYVTTEGRRVIDIRSPGKVYFVPSSEKNFSLIIYIPNIL
jgi:hypothetical protein